MPRITGEQRNLVLELHERGISRNEIARKVGISPGSVTNICRAAGRAFDRSATKDATRAHTADLAEARLNLAHRIDKAANDMLDMLGKPFTVYNFGGKDNTFNSAELDQPPVDAQRTIITSAAIAFDKLTRIVEKDTGGVEGAAGLLDQVAGALSSAADVLREEPDAGAE